jgi:hypothetical protein
MKSFTVLRASAFRGLKPQLFETIAPLELVEAAKQRYNFVKVPIAEKNEPFDFQIGKLKVDGKVIKIDQFVVSYIGTQATSLGAATRTTTDDADLFLDDLIAWSQEEFGLDTDSLFPPAYHGQVEFVLEKGQLADRFKKLNGLGDAITKIIRGYGLNECPDFALNSFSMHFDTNDPALTKPIPTVFAVERRVTARYAENKYFSQAPLKTADHKAVLEQLEKILST